MILRIFAVAGALLALAVAAPSAWAQGGETYPTKPVRVLVGFAPGGPTDVVARVIGQRLGDVWKQTIVVENRPGASGMVATQLAARAAPDGYTVLLTTTSFAVSPSISRSASYDPVKDFAPSVVAAWSPNIFVVHPSVKAATLREFVALARGSSALNYGSPGVGTTPYLSAELLFRLLAKVDVTQVPYNGGAPALAAVAAGHIHMAVVAMPPAVPMVQAGQLRGLAVTGTKRVATLPDVPTAAEAGFPDIQDYTWFAYLYPSGTPAAIVERLNVEVNAALKLPEVIDRLARTGFEPVGGTTAEAALYVSSEIGRWAKIVKDLGVAVE
jgi:tripartite-type tricarboxylate transporter receptor subunit TctC